MNESSDFDNTQNFHSDQLLPFDPALYNFVPIAIYICDLDGKIIYYNDAATELWGEKPGADEKWGGFAEVFDETGTFVKKDEGPVSKIIKKDVIVGEINYLCIRKDGKKINVFANPQPLINAKGEKIGVINSLMDITHKVENEEKNGRLAAIVETCGDTILSHTLDGFITSWNKAAEKMFGYSEQEVLGMHISAFIPENKAGEAEAFQKKALSEGKSLNFDTIRLDKNGNEVHVSLSVSPVLDSANRVIGISKIAHDISDLQIAVQKQSILAAIVDGSDDTILSKTLDGIITSWNRAAEIMFGYTESEMIGQHISVLIPPNRLTEEDHIIKIIRAGQRIEHFETIRIKKDGTEVAISLTISPIYNSTGKIIGASKIARDISLRNKLLENNLSYIKNLESINSIAKSVSQELNLKKILQIVIDATTTLVGARYGAFLHGKITDGGKYYPLFTLSGISKEELDIDYLSTSKEEFRESILNSAIIRSIDINEDIRLEHINPVVTSTFKKLDVKSFLSIPVKKPDGTSLGILIFCHPNTAVFTPEHEIILLAVAAQAAISIDNARLYEEVKFLNEKKDEFIGLASHELKTPLTSISGYLQILNKIVKEEHQQKFIDKTLKMVGKLTSLVNDILDISKIQAGKLTFGREIINLNEAVYESVELLNYSQQTHKIIFNPWPEKIEIMGDQQRLDQVIINLLTNAVKYSPAHSEVILTIKKHKKEITISVQDFGIGIPEESLDHIFSRFYRVEGLKHEMSGLGIGLYITKEIIDKHNGRIWAESALGKGSTFFITLPIK